MKIPFFSKSKKENLNISVFGLTNIGLKRRNNEDSFLSLPGFDSGAQDQALMAVADGMGGHSSGEVASGIAISCIRRDLSFEKIRCKNDESDIHEYMVKTLHDANSEIFVKGGESSERAMGTTCTVGLIRNGTLHLAHVGDSRAYLLRGNKLSQISVDHSWVMEQVAAGKLTQDEARTHPNRNIITRALGIQESVEVQIDSIPLRRNDRILMCSDGLSGLVDDCDINSALAEFTVKESVGRLLKLAILAGGDDNITVVLGEIL